MIKSMTGFASAAGAHAPYSWTWEIRSVNGRGLDLRLRVPDWVDGLEAGLRKTLTSQLGRGNVSCNLRLTREESDGALRVNADQLATLLAAMQQIETAAMDAGVSLAPSRASDILGMRGVLEHSAESDQAEGLADVLLASFAPVLEEFEVMRAREGAALAEVLEGQLDQIASLTDEVQALLPERQAALADGLRANLARVMDNTEGADADRVAQELALIAVKADVTEELDRLRAHVSAAREHLAKGGPVGRKLDFLMQEFNREANTLCSKAQHQGLTAVGLSLKAVIDQMREQVQNVE